MIINYFIYLSDKFYYIAILLLSKMKFKEHLKNTAENKFRQGLGCKEKKLIPYHN